MLRDVVNSGLRAAHLELRRKPRSLIRSQSELAPTLDLVAAHWVTHHPDQIATAVQIGAFDGDENDPLADALVRYGWRAVLVEPQADPAEALRNRYGNNPDVTVVQAAIGDTDGQRILYS